MKVRPVGDELFHADGRTDSRRDKASSRFSQFCAEVGDDIKTKLNSVALVRERTIPTERPPPVDEVSANFCG